MGSGKPVHMGSNAFQCFVYKTKQEHSAQFLFNSSEVEVQPSVFSTKHQVTYSS